MFFRVVLAEATKNVRQHFFSARVLFWTLALPLGNGLYLYFLYLPFNAKTVQLEYNASSFTLDLAGFTLIGQLLYSFFTMMLLAGVAFDTERWQGTLESVLLSPASRVAVLLGMAFANTLNYVWLLMGVLLSWVVFLNVTVLINDILALFASILLSYLSLVALGMSLEAFCIYSRRAHMYANMLQEPIMFLSGLIFPLQSMPKALLPISYLLPLTFGLISVRLTLLGGASISDVAVPLIMLSLMVACFSALAIWLIGYAERSAKAKATLTQF
ncbi:MAG: ABC transporter permease [Candidatus Bathyarchaeota archaeon]|nr:ABC transporter permease [Candidatus Bathyarchaeota archaeon]MDH5495318.1 ABC transporter permease [Candidatus Bathyarchaeota archaeon]